MELKRPIYLDYQATTPLDPEVLDEMMPYLTDNFGNASSKENEYGWAADAGVDLARERVAKLIGAEPEEIYFTSGATEGANIALSGLISESRISNPHVITTQIEHSCVLEPLKFLEGHGISLSLLPVDLCGTLLMENLKDAIRPETILVSVMYANNEIGTIQNIREIGRICEENGLIFFSDLAQGLSTQNINVKDLGIHVAAMSAHKIYGPKGVGALYVSRKSPRIELAPLFRGGGQENGLRSGTLNVPGIVGLGKAAEILIRKRDEEALRLKSYRDRFVKQLSRAPGVGFNGNPESQLPHSVSFTVSGVVGESLLLATRQLAYASGSACSSAKIEPSHVLRAIGLDEEASRSTLRVSFGRFTEEEDVDFAAEVLVDSITKLKKLSSQFGDSSLTPAGSKEIRN